MSLKDAAEKALQSAVNLSLEDRFDEAAEKAGEIISLREVYVQALVQSGRANWEMRRWDLAMEQFKLAQTIAPGSDDIRWTVALMHLQQGEFREAAMGIESRWKSSKFDSPKLITSKPTWNKYGKFNHVLIWSEQGIGDQIFYMSFIREVARYTPKITVMCDYRLIPLLKRSTPWVNFVPQTERVIGVDSQIPMGSLFTQFVSEKADIKKVRHHSNLLMPDRDRGNGFYDDLKIKENEILIGISWASGAPKIGNHKSCSLEDLMPIFKIPNARFVSLQYGDHFEEIFEFRKKHGITIETVVDVDNTADIDGLASLIWACDAVVTVSNVTGHLSGGIGIRTFLLDSNKLWYWGNCDGNRNLWYPAVKTYRKWHATAKWDRQIEDIRTDITKWIAGRDGNGEETFVFYRSAKTEEEIRYTRIFVKSLLASNPKATVIMCTTRETPIIEGVVRMEFVPAGDPDDYMVHRLQAYSLLKLNRPAMYLDDDMIIQQELSPSMLLGPLGTDVAFCVRHFDKDSMFNPNIRGLDFSEHKGKTIGQVFPLQSCVSVTRDHRPWDDMLDILDHIDPKYRKWYGDMMAINIYAKMNSFTTIDEEDYGCVPEHSGAKAPKIIHFKGNRKPLMEKWKL